MTPPDSTSTATALPAGPSALAVEAGALRPRSKRPRRGIEIVGDTSGVDGRGRRIALRLASIGLFGSIWWLVTALGVWDPVFVPRPAAVWNRFVESLQTTTVTTSSGLEITRRGLSGYTLWEHWWASVSRILQGTFWAVAVGVPLGLLLSTVRWFRLMFEPWLDFLRSLPPLAYFSLLVIWFGIADTSKIWLLFLAGIAPIALSIVSGARGIPRDRLLAAQALGASRLQTIRHLVLPSVLPEFFNGFRLAVGFAWTTIVAAETTDGIPGIGGLAWVSKKFQQTDTVVLCIITIGITALILDYGIKALDRRLVPWRGRS